MPKVAMEVLNSVVENTVFNGHQMATLTCTVLMFSYSENSSKFFISYQILGIRVDLIHNRTKVEILILFCFLLLYFDHFVNILTFILLIKCHIDFVNSRYTSFHEVVFFSWLYNWCKFPQGVLIYLFAAL